MCSADRFVRRGTILGWTVCSLHHFNLLWVVSQTCVCSLSDLRRSAGSLTGDFSFHYTHTGFRSGSTGSTGTPCQLMRQLACVRQFYSALGKRAIHCALLTNLPRAQVSANRPKLANQRKWPTLASSLTDLLCPLFAAHVHSHSYFHLLDRCPGKRVCIWYGQYRVSVGERL